jgi:hypothetical protein
MKTVTLNEALTKHFATPPVRGDRETIAEIAGELEDLAGDFTESEPATADILERIADKLSALSLPVLPVRVSGKPLASCVVGQKHIVTRPNIGSRLTRMRSSFRLIWSAPPICSRPPAKPRTPAGRMDGERTIHNTQRIAERA